jgi:hypothetical protein
MSRCGLSVGRPLQASPVVLTFQDMPCVCAAVWLQVYDAYLFVQYVGGAAGVPSPWDLVSLAWSPLRLAFNRIHACMPGFCRWGYMLACLA